MSGVRAALLLLWLVVCIGSAQSTPCHPGPAGRRETSAPGKSLEDKPDVWGMAGEGLCSVSLARLDFVPLRGRLAPRKVGSLQASGTGTGVRVSPQGAGLLPREGLSLLVRAIGCGRCRPDFPDAPGASAAAGGLRGHAARLPGGQLCSLLPAWAREGLSRPCPPG